MSENWFDLTTLDSMSSAAKCTTAGPRFNTRLDVLSSDTIKPRLFVGQIIASLWHMTCTSVGVLSMYLSNFIAIGQLWIHISRLRDFTRSYHKTSRICVRIMKYTIVLLMVFACGVSPRTDFILIILCLDVLLIKHFGNKLFTINFRICNLCFVLCKLVGGMVSSCW